MTWIHALGEKELVEFFLLVLAGWTVEASHHVTHYVVVIVVILKKRRKVHKRHRKIKAVRRRKQLPHAQAPGRRAA